MYVLCKAGIKMNKKDTYVYILSDVNTQHMWP